MTDLRFIRCTKSLPCPICGRDHYCGVRADGLVHCTKVSSDHPTSNGWLHRTDGRVAAAASRSDKVEPPKMRVAEATLLARQCHADMTDRRWEELSQMLGISIRSLKLHRAGWHIARSLFTFPMRDPAGRVVGIRTRHPVTGEKKCIETSTLGLFIPASFDDAADPSTLIIVEGPTDAAAIADLGFRAIGKPDVSNKADWVVEFVRLNPHPRIIIIADDDTMKGHDRGWHFSDLLARRIVNETPIDAVRVLQAPHGFKDVRAWLNSGNASHEELAAHLDAQAINRIEVAA